jgi:hypothetical protein
MRKMLIVAASLALGAAHAEPSKAPADPEIVELAKRAMDTYTLHFSYLRKDFCGGGSARKVDVANAEFVACVMYVLGAVDMIREWQKIDPVHALPMCIPRTAGGGDLINAVQQHIEATSPSQRQQSDAATVVIAALAAKWPCQGSR